MMILLEGKFINAANEPM